MSKSGNLGARQIGLLGVTTLVLLRVVIGVHFLDQGLDKFSPSFSSEGFLRSATGPLAETFQSMAYGVHGVDTLLFVPQEWTDETPKQIASLAAWSKGYQKRLAQAADTKKPKPITDNWELPDGPPTAWFNSISTDWEQYSRDAANLAGDADDDAAGKACRAAFLSWQGKLGAYLAGQAEAIAEYQNELWRLEKLKDKAEPGTLPYNDERSAKKYNETFATSRQWVAGVRSLESIYRDELIAIAEQAGADRGKASAAVEPWTQLDTINELVKWTVVGVGACLMLGLCTRLAAVVGAGFLCSVIATQPPWVYGAEDVWFQLVEVAGMSVIAATGAGQWLGLDTLWKHLWPALSDA